MNDQEIRARVKRVLVERLALEGLTPEEIDDEAALSEELGLDSVDALELVLGLEQEFQVEIQGKGLDAETFASVRTLAGFVKARLSSAGAGAAAARRAPEQER